MLLILVPIILAVLVYMFTKDQPKVYSTESIIYTGIGSGYSIETANQTRTNYLTLNIQFDNMIQIINSRQTIEQVSIRLLAQHLSLQEQNKKYISREHYNQLQKIVPKRIKDLVVRFGKTGAERDKIEQIRSLESEIENLREELSKKKDGEKQGARQTETRNTQKTGQNQQTTTRASQQRVTQQGERPEIGNNFHEVRSGESLSEISRKYNISIEKIKELNYLSRERVYAGERLLINPKVKNYYRLHRVQPGETLYSVARQFGVEVSELKKLNELHTTELLVGELLIVEPLKEGEGYARVDMPPEEPVVQEVEEFGPEYGKDRIVPPGVNVSDYEATVNNFMAHYYSSDTNFIYELLNYTHPHYSINAIKNNISVNRVKNSDLIQISYQSDDPGICQQTLKIMNNMFIKNFKELKAIQTDAVVRYFEREVEKANEELKDAEDALLKFNQKNDIINYNEQTKYIAEQKEELDVFFQNQQIKMSSAAAALNDLERKLSVKDSIYLNSAELIQKRQRLSNINEKITLNQLTTEYDPYLDKELGELKSEAKDLKTDIKRYVDRLYAYTHTTEGIPIQTLLNQWLNNMIQYEEAKASLQVLRNRKKDFRETYETFAPLGATLKRLERAIGVAEESYLEALRSLNLAKMRQKNLEMATNIKVVDSPHFPLSPTAGNTKILVLAAAIIGFLMVAFVIIVLEYFDNTLKTPQRAEKKTGLPLAGVYPDLNSKDRNKYNFPLILDRLAEMIVQNLYLRLTDVMETKKMSDEAEATPWIILVMSTQNQTGKTLVTNRVIEKLRSVGDNVLFLNYMSDDENKTEEDNNFTFTYKLGNRFVKVDSVGDLVESHYLRQENYQYDYIFIEIPAIVQNAYPIKLMKHVDASMLFVYAKQFWQKADKMALETFQKVAEQDPLLILNGIELHHVKDTINGLPPSGKSSGLGRLGRAVRYPGRLRVTVKE
ncbi:MAG: LysM peptidoglycan-binding domain-containing protein [Bacteroidales bacterium]|nr:LysM peptidoglycan-binding domain-containing protein [Bacteroidales bacterium]